MVATLYLQQILDSFYHGDRPECAYILQFGLANHPEMRNQRAHHVVYHNNYLAKLDWSLIQWNQIRDLIKTNNNNCISNLSIHTFNPSLIIIYIKLSEIYWKTLERHLKSFEAFYIHILEILILMCRYDHWLASWVGSCLYFRWNFLF